MGASDEGGCGAVSGPVSEQRGGEVRYCVVVVVACLILLLVRCCRCVGFAACVSCGIVSIFQVTCVLGQCLFPVYGVVLALMLLSCWIDSCRCVLFGTNFPPSRMSIGG